MKEMAEKTRKAREAEAKHEAETAEKTRAWSEAKEREMVEIVRLADEAKYKT